MKKTAALLILTISTSAFGRIGETPEECADRYGEPLKITDDHEGKADLIVFQKLEKNALGKSVAMSDNEIETLLKINSDGKEWKISPVISMDREWATTDGSMHALYKTFDNTLMLATDAFIKRADEEKKASENEQLEGF